MVTKIFFHNHNYQGSIGKFIYKASILDNKQLLSYLIDHKATQVPYTTSIAFLADSYIFCSNFPTILCNIAIDSYITLWWQHFEQKLKVASYIWVYRFLAKW